MRARSLKPAAVLALVAVYILWGSTAPAIRVAVTNVPPWSMAAIRFIIAGGLLWGWVRLRRVPMPSAREWRDAAILGGLMLVGGNGVFAWCLQYIPGGVGSLFFSLAPLFMALFAFALYAEPVSALAAAGLILGFGGMVYLIAPAGTVAVPLVPGLFAVGSAVSWALGSVLQRRAAAHDVVQASAMQMLCASLALGAFALIVHEKPTAAEFTPPAIVAILFLIVGGSIIGYSTYVWLLRNVSTVIASSIGYVNPIVALAIGVTLLHERMTPHIAISALVIIAGVAMMLTAPSPRTVLEQSP